MSQRDFAGWAESRHVPPDLDTSVAHPARVYDYWLGGKDNFAADRQAGEAFAAIYPAIRTGTRENRAFLRRAVTYLSKAGVRQFLDVGTGIPTSDNTHEVAQRLAAESRIVYVDNDPIVLSHARVLLTSTAEGETGYIDADVRDPDFILGHAGLHQTLDMSQPVGLMMLMVLQLVEAEDLYSVVGRYVDALPSGSYVAISHPTADFVTPEVGSMLMETYSRSGMYFRLRTREEFARFFAGLELVSPGIVPVAEWRAEDEPQPRPDPADASGYAAIGRKA